MSRHESPSGLGTVLYYGFYVIAFVAFAAYAVYSVSG